MNNDLLRPPSPGNPDCPADSVKSALAGADAPDAAARGARRVLLLGVGLVSLGTGIIGIFVPILPTTCFLLLAAWCFGKSSPRLLYWMLHNRWFGVYLRDYRAGRGIPRSVKIGSLSILWVTIAASVLFAVSVLWVRLLLIAIAAAVTVHVAGLRNSRALRPDSST